MKKLHNDFYVIQREELKPHYFNAEAKGLKICLAPYAHLRKPQDIEIKRIQISFKEGRPPIRTEGGVDESGQPYTYQEEKVNYRKEGYNIYQVMGAILSGWSFLTGYTVNGSTNGAWLSSHMLGIDIDDGLTIEEALKRCEQYGIYPTAVYPTFSHQEKLDKDENPIEKFRMLFIFDEPVEQVGIQKMLISMIMEIFSECDSACKNICRLWHGTNKGWFIIRGRLEELHNKTLNHQRLVEAFYMHVDRTKMENRARFFKDFCTTHHIRYKGHRPYIDMLADGKTIKPYWTDEERANSIKTIKAVTTTRGKAKVVYEKGEKVKREPKDQQPIKRNVNFDGIAEKCYLFGKARVGDYWLSEPELVHLIKNLQGCEDGKKELETIILENPQFYNNDKHNQQYYLDKIDVIEFRFHSVTSCKNNCKFYQTERCQCIGKTILDNIDKTVPTIDRDSTVNKVSIEEGQANFLKAYMSAIKSEQEGIHVIKSSMGLGKTQQLANMDNWIQYMPVQDPTTSESKIIIAEPTHVMRGELGCRLCQNLSDSLNTKVVQVLPKPPMEKICYDDEVIKRYKAYQKMGAHELCAKMHNKAIDQAILDQNVECMEYMENTKLIKDRNVRALITTHDKVLLTHEFEDAQLIIFDEDPTQRLLKTGETSIEDLERLRDVLLHLKGVAERTGCNEQVFYASQEVNDNVISLEKQISKLENLIEHLKTVRDELLSSRTDKNVIDKPINMEKCIEVDVKSLGRIPTNRIKLPKTDVMSFLKCNNYVVYAEGKIVYMTKQFLPKGKKYIILSGTANEQVCKMLFGGQLAAFYDCGIVENQATVYQNIGKSFNKRFLKGNIQDIVNNTFELNPQLERERTVVITHSGYKNAVEHAHVYSDGYENQIVHKEQVRVIDSMWYGATEGKNGFYETMIENGVSRKRLEGETPYFNTLMLVGKFVAPMEIYKMWIKAIGVEDNELVVSKNVNVERYGITNQLATFENEQSREIHLWVIESELRQALGRARQIRPEQKDVKVIVYTDLILPETDIVVYADMEVRGECLYNLDVAS